MQPGQVMSFSKDGKRLNVHAYRGINAGTDVPLEDPKGTKLDLLYGSP